jgi:hypothetical protein
MRSDNRDLGLGIILVDDVYPGFPGDVRNASAYPFPIQYEIAEGVDLDKLVVAEDKSPCLAPVQRAARRLERLGCRAIAAECGYFAYFQREIARHVAVPVFLSSLLQVPLAQRLVGPRKVVGILAASRAFLTDAHLQAVGVEIGSNYVVGGALDEGRCPEFENLWVSGVRPQPPGADYETAGRDLVAIGVDFFRAQANMGAMVLECTGFPPFARALQRQIEIPIFSWGTLLDYAYAVAVHRDDYGHV